MFLLIMLLYGFRVSYVFKMFTCIITDHSVYDLYFCNYITYIKILLIIIGITY